MGADLINRVIAAVGAQVVAAVEALTPVGLALTGSFVILGVLFLGLAVASGQSIMIAGIARMTAAAAGTMWVIQYWADIVRGTLQASRAALGLLIPGYNGPTALFTMAIELAGRIELEHVAWNWTSPMVSMAAAGMAAVVPLFVFIGLSFTGILAVVAEFQLLIGATAAPLILPALAFPVTVPLGWGPIYFIVKAGVRVVVMGLTSFVMANAVSSLLTVPGSTDGLTSETIFTLAGLSLLTMMVGLYCNSLAHDLVGGGAGSMGLGAVSATTGAASSMARGTVAAAGAIANPKAAAARIAASSARAAGGTALNRSSDRAKAFA